MGAGLLLLGGLISAAVILAGKDGPVLGYGAYAAAVLWALVGVIVNQYGSSLITTTAAVTAAVAVVVVLLDTLRRSRPPTAGRSTRPRVV